MDSHNWPSVPFSVTVKGPPKTYPARFLLQIVDSVKQPANYTRMVRRPQTGWSLVFPVVIEQVRLHRYGLIEGENNVDALIVHRFLV